MTLSDYLYRNKNASEKQIKDVISGHLCRCTGYSSIIKAAVQSAKEINNNVNNTDILLSAMDRDANSIAIIDGKNLSLTKSYLLKLAKLEKSLNL